MAIEHSASTTRNFIAGLKLSVLTLGSRILGLIREITRASFMGTGLLADAFTVAFIIPNFLRRLFAEGSITIAFIPVFSEYLSDEGPGHKERTNEFLSAMFTVLLILVCSVVVLGILFTPYIVKLFGSDPSETTILTRIMFPFLALVSFAAFLQGILNSLKIFTPSGFAPILFNLCFIVFPYLLGNVLGNPARAMAAGVIVGGLAQALCQLPSVLRTVYQFGFMHPLRAFAHPGVRKVLLLIAPTLIGVAAYQFNDLVSTSLASHAGAGVASSIQYSLRLQELILGIFVVSASTVLLPTLSRAVGKADYKEFSSELGLSLQVISLITIPVTIFSLVMGQDIITLLFKRAAFDDNSVRLTSTIFFYHMLGLYAISLNRILAPAFYALKDTKHPSYAGIISFGTNIVLALILVRFMGGRGIALALSLASLVNALLLLYLLVRKKIPGLSTMLFSSLINLLKILVFSIIAVLPLVLAKNQARELLQASFSPFWSYTGLVLIAFIIFAGIGLLLLLASKDRALAFIINIARRRK